tara:strand:+ start:75 stop:716 length:642 start_codon:yes stop_codon:yes gene_type:complete
MDCPSYYAIIPAEVRYSNLKPNAKLLYGEITSLTHKEGYCFATNNYFATLYKVSKNTVSTWISSLEKSGFINIDMIYKDKQIVERRITIKNLEGIFKNDERGIIEKNKDNNTSTNIKNNINIRKLKFEEKVFQVTDISKDELQNFVDYWTEQNPKGTKMKFEMQKTFDINLRLKRWIFNSKAWNRNNVKSKINNQLTEHQKAMQMVKNINTNE